MESGFEIEVTKGEFSLKAKGFKPLTQVGQYIADAAGVIGEPLGYLKDTFASYRVHREQAAAVAMLRAKQIAEERGSKLSSVSHKFL